MNNDWSGLTSNPEYKQAVKDWEFMRNQLESLRNKEYLAFKKITEMETNFKKSQGLKIKDA